MLIILPLNDITDRFNMYMVNSKAHTCDLSILKDEPQSHCKEDLLTGNEIESQIHHIIN